MLLALILATVLRGPADVETLTRDADVVVHARVVRADAAVAPDGGTIFTTVVLRTLESWKGDASGELRVVNDGGCAGELCQTVAGVAAFRANEEVVVFLKRQPRGVHEVVRWALGKFAVGAASARLPKRALRDRTGITCVGCGADEQDDLSLADLRTRVLRSAAK